MAEWRRRARETVKSWKKRLGERRPRPRGGEVLEERRGWATLYLGANSGDRHPDVHPNLVRLYFVLCHTMGANSYEGSGQAIHR